MPLVIFPFGLPSDLKCIKEAYFTWQSNRANRRLAEPEGWACNIKGTPQMRRGADSTNTSSPFLC